MLARNRAFARALAASVLATAALALVLGSVPGAPPALCVAAGALAAALPLCALTVARYRAIARLAERLDERLHSDRAPGFDDMREGELAVLASELGKLTQRLALTAEQLERERARLADALADISHQLKTPLTQLSLTTELIRARVAASGGVGIDAAAVRDIASRLRRAELLQERIGWLVSALLKLARIDAGTVALAAEHVDAAKLVDEAVSGLAIAFDIADVAVDVSVQPGAGFRGDARWSAEALANVLKNCIEHTPAGGCVRIRATEDALACRIAVEDTGGGIAEEDLPHIFERFYRGRGAGGAAGEVEPAGVGIGLALAKSLVTAQGGRITACNATGPDGRVSGARFTIAFFKAVV